MKHIIILLSLISFCFGQYDIYSRFGNFLSTDDQFNILIIADPQASIGSSHHYKRAMHDRQITLGKALSPDFYIMLGDYTELFNDTLTKSLFQTYESSLGIDKYYVIGNHDIYGSGVAVDYDSINFYGKVDTFYNYYDNIDDAYLRSSANTTREDTLGYYHTEITTSGNIIDLIVLNNCHRDTSDATGWYYLGDTQYTWFKNKLDALTGAKRVMVAMHVPLYQANNELAVRTTLSDSLVNIVADWQHTNQTGYFLGFFSGHAHTPNDTTIKKEARGYNIYDVDCYTFANTYHLSNYVWGGSNDSLGYALVNWDESSNLLTITGYGLTMSYSKQFPSYTTPSLITHVSFAQDDTVSATVAGDLSGNGHTATLNGTVAYENDDTGTANGALTLNGSNTYARIADFDESEGNGYKYLTVMIRFKSSGETQDIFNHYDSGVSPPQIAWRFLILAAGYRMYGSGDGTTDGGQFIERRDGDDYTDGAWHHVALVFDGDETVPNTSNMQTYMDGVKNIAWDTSPGLPDPTLTAFHNSTIDLLVGAILSNSVLANYTTGAVCDYRIYNEVLTTNEIMAIYSE